MSYFLGLVLFSTIIFFPLPSLASLIQSKPVPIQRRVGNYSARFYLIASNVLLQVSAIQEMTLNATRSCMVQCMLNSQCNCFGFLRSNDAISKCLLYNYELSSDASVFQDSPGWDFYSTGKIKLAYCNPGSSSTFCVHYKTCEEALHSGVPSDSKVLIKPSFSAKPLIVTCRLEDESWSNITIFHHNQEETVNVPNSPYWREFTYENEIKDIANAVEYSDQCAQYTLLDCYNSKLNALLLYARKKTRLTYWGGGQSSVQGCECGLTGSCNDTSKLCNCYTVSVISPFVDSGYITHKSHLPLTEIELSPYIAILGSLKYKIGPLYCIGIK